MCKYNSGGITNSLVPVSNKVQLVHDSVLVKLLRKETYTGELSHWPTEVNQRIFPNLDYLRNHKVVN